MAVTISFELEGLDRALAWFDAYAQQVRDGTAAGLYQSALYIMARSQEIVPIGLAPEDKTPGTLRSSGTVLLPVIDGNQITVEFGYGGAASAYAERQHEDLMYRHHDGQQAKFLERPLMEYQDQILGNVVDAIQKAA